MIKMTDARLWSAFQDAIVTVLNRAGHSDKVVKAISIMESKKPEVMEVILSGDFLAIDAKTVEIIRAINRECTSDA
jgi:hypothetical protein